MAVLRTIRNFGRRLIGKPPLGEYEHTFTTGRKRGMKLAQIGLLLGTLTGVGYLVAPEIINWINPPAKTRLLENPRRGEVLIDMGNWLNNFTCELSPGSQTHFVCDPNWDPNSFRDQIVSEGMPWGIGFARQLDDQEQVDRFLRGLVYHMMGRGLPSWQGHIENGKYKVTSQDPALDADLQMASELTQLANQFSSGEFNYEVLAQQFWNMVYSTYVYNDGAFASLAPTKYDRGGARGHLKAVHYVSIADLEAARGFDSDARHDWKKLMEDEQTIREVIISQSSYLTGKKHKTTKEDLTTETWKPYSHIPDWVVLSVKTVRENGKLVNKYKVYRASGRRSYKFGRDAVRALWLISKDALYLKDKSLRERNIVLARRMMDAMKDKNIPEDIEIFDYYGGNPEKNKDVVLAGYMALAYAASQRLSGDDGNEATQYKELFKRLKKKLDRRHPNIGKNYYEDSIIFFCKLMIDKLFIWDPKARFNDDESKELQSTKRKHWGYPFSHLQYIAWRNAHERAELDLLPLIRAVDTSGSTSTASRISSRVSGPLITPNGKIADSKTIMLQRRLRLAGQFKAFFLVDAAIEQYVHILTHASLSNNRREIAAAAAGLEGIIKDGGISAFEAVLIYERILKKNSSNLYANMGLARALLNTYRIEFIPEILTRAKTGLKKSDPRLYARASLLMAEGIIRRGEKVEAALARGESNRSLADVNGLFEIAMRRLQEALAVLVERVGRLDTKNTGLTYYFDTYISTAGTLGIDIRKLGELRAVTRYQLGDAFRRRGELELRTIADRMSDYNSASTNFRISLEDREIPPDLALGAVLSMANSLRRAAEIAVRNINHNETGPLKKSTKKLLAGGDPDPSRRLSPEKMEILKTAQRYHAQARTIISLAIACLNDRTVNTTQIDGITRYAVRRGMRVVKQGTAHPSRYAPMLRTRVERQKRKYKLKVNELDLRTVQLALIEESNQKPLSAMEPHMNAIINASPRYRVRSHFERIIYFLQRGETIRAEKDAVSVAGVARIVSENIDSPENIRSETFSTEIEEAFRTLSFAGRTIQALGNNGRSLEEMEKHLANLGVKDAKKIMNNIRKLLKKRFNKEANKKRAKGIVQDILVGILEKLDGNTKSPRAKSVIARAVEMFRDGKFEDASELLERVVEENIILKYYIEKIKRNKDRVIKEMVVLTKISRILRALKNKRFSKKGALYIAKKLATECDYRLGEFAYTSAWFKKMIGAYVISAWAVFNSGDKESAISMLHEILGEDHKPVSQDGLARRVARRFIRLIRDKENRGLLNIVLDSQPRLKKQILKELGKMYQYTHREEQALQYYWRYLGLRPDTMSKAPRGEREMVYRDAERRNPQNASMVNRIRRLERRIRRNTSRRGGGSR